MSNRVLSFLVVISLGFGLFSTWKHLFKDAEEIADLTIQGMEIRQKKAEAEETAKQQAALKQKAAELNADTTSPSLGNTKSDVSIVYFFDYRCGYCRRGSPVLDELVQTDPYLRVIYKEFPIFQDTVVAATALAAHEQDRYVDMHRALMAHDGKFTKETVLKIAKDLKLDMKKLEADMTGKTVKNALIQNRKLANELGIKGTPMFIVGGTLTLPGAVSVDEFRSAIEKIRKDRLENR